MGLKAFPRIIKKKKEFKSNYLTKTSPLVLDGFQLPKWYPTLGALLTWTIEKVKVKGTGLI